jgi:hypothetical protein
MGSTIFYGVKYLTGLLWKNKKVMIFLAVVAFALISFTQYQSSQNPQVEAQPYEQLPRQLTGLDVIQTTTRHYYIVSSYETESQITLTDFYAYDDKWVRYDTIPLTLDKTDIRIYKN